MANEREIEAREACAKLGITNVWFLDGKDTASQNLMDSLANWGHGANLERLVGLIRLTRPEVVFTHFPGVFIGENHGDHQATGVLVTEAFDLAADPVVFPSQLAGDTKPLRILSVESADLATEEDLLRQRRGRLTSNLSAPDRPIPFERFHPHRRNPTGAWRWIPRWPIARNFPRISSAFRN